MKAKSTDSLPKMLPGTLCVQWVRCGRKGCRCAGEALHGPYYYRFWRENGKLRKAYVPTSELEETRAACAAKKVHRRSIKRAWDVWKQLQNSIREAEQK